MIVAVGVTAVNVISAFRGFFVTLFSFVADGVFTECDFISADGLAGAIP